MYVIPHTALSDQLGDLSFLQTQSLPQTSQGYASFSAASLGRSLICDTHDAQDKHNKYDAVYFPLK